MATSRTGCCAHPCSPLLLLLLSVLIPSAAVSNATLGNASTTTTTTTTTSTTTFATPRTLVDVMGQSGKFTVYNEAAGRASGIQVTMDALREQDASGNAVGTASATKHSLNTFAAQNFTILPAETVTLANSTVEATKISFSSSVSTIGTVRVDTFVMRRSGTVSTPSETWSVAAGDLKWNIELSNWTWCGCRKGQTNEVGAFIDLDVTVKGLASAQKTSGKTVSLGGGVNVELSNQVIVDGAWQTMPNGFPSVSVQGAATTFTFRFPRFAHQAVYDPVLTGLAASVSTTAAATTAAATTAAATTAAATTAAATTTAAGGASTTAGAGTTTTAAAGATTTATTAAGATTATAASTTTIASAGSTTVSGSSTPAASSTTVVVGGSATSTTSARAGQESSMAPATHAHVGLTILACLSFFVW